MTETTDRQIGELVSCVEGLQHRFDRMEDWLRAWIESHEREAGARNEAISNLQAFRAQAVIIAMVVGSALTLFGEYLINH